MICFLGNSHAARFLREAAGKRGIELGGIHDADVIFVSEDTPTYENGERNLEPIHALVSEARKHDKPIVLTSQVPPGFTRSLGIENIHHQAETLRIIDADARAMYPDYIAVGGEAPIHPSYLKYLLAFDCPVLRMSWEEAEFSKIAVNMMLAAQVDATNHLAEAAKKVGADWEPVAQALANDKRIGKHAYLKPGRWQNSTHLMRDYVTLEAISES